ncbi:MAG: hypothetical protein U0Z44_21455 [Kouleothrix sp.]
MLNNEFPPLGGGTGTVNRAIVQRLAGAPELEIDLVTSALGRAPEHERLAERVRVFKVPVHNRNLHHSSNRELLTYAARALPLARRLHAAQPYDLCFAWSAVPAGGVALALRRLTGLRYVARVCGLDHPRLRAALWPALPRAGAGYPRNLARCRASGGQVRARGRDDPRRRCPRAGDAGSQWG